MDFDNSEVLKTLKCIESPEEATKYTNTLFNQMHQCYSGHRLPLNNDISNQKKFKMVEDIIEHGIQTNNARSLYYGYVYLYILLRRE